MGLVTNDRGFTLVEVLAALVIFGLIVAGMGPIFLQQLKHNHTSEIKTEAMGAAQIVLDRIRTVDPTSLPTSGSGSPQSVTVGTRTFEVTPTYCENAGFCSSTSVRHIRVRVRYKSELVFTTQTVYAQLR